MPTVSTSAVKFRFFVNAAALLMLTVVCAQASSDDRAKQNPFDGRWQAQLQIPSGPVAFGLEISAQGDGGAKAAILNGPERTEFTGGRLEGKRLRLFIDYYDGELSAQLDEASGALVGEYVRQTNKGPGRFAFRAVRGEAAAPSSMTSASARTERLTKDWVVTLQTKAKSKTNVALFSVSPAGANSAAPGAITATLIPVSGDYGLLAGSAWRANRTTTKFRLSRFDGIHVTLLTGTLLPNGTLRGELANGTSYRADWTAAPKARVLAGKAAPLDPFAVAKVKDPSAPFSFALPDLTGKTVTLSDERFRGKALIVDIFGTWCPNCHDEVPLLVELYQKYKNDGLEIIGLSYEYPGEATRADRQVETFRRRYQIEFPLLLAGTTDEGEIARTLPQLENFAAYPTTLFIGRDGRVHKIHTGFSGPSTGVRYLETKREFEKIVQEILK